ncbi:hypothetical protein EPUS_04737 [Endocarpon pusillum Z07020]|uniref:Uncharacterized protein n=1 Tax=Endocarpon pusillum (strain Z07020 / HMAS-L-300199) TaxID=1263415 RepID=U1HN48_ENDPU|nr:uncharacterized protein EPUS_04737 [Endocarpon pusillum Z07020]ERF70459.1 hypothetical protein EPUS_04737 [Endocarpon pusillum Z07020]
MPVRNHEKRQLGAVTDVAGQVSETADNLEFHSINEKRQAAVDTSAVSGIVTNILGLAGGLAGDAVGVTVESLGSVLGVVVGGVFESVLGGALGGTLGIRDDGEFHNIDKKN